MNVRSVWEGGGVGDGGTGIALSLVFNFNLIASLELRPNGDVNKFQMKKKHLLPTHLKIHTHTHKHIS